MFHLSFGGSSNIVFEHFRNSFDLEDSTNGFIQLHQLCSHVAMNCILGSMVQVIGVNWFLAVAKPFKGIRSIAVGKCFISW